ncbi:hypothetical protein COU49_01015 [Candidatus Nomurabacteria bacterium CG10_big_fil_rev_8_21_14_0_10_35_16]|uniref:Uncharacterized protein n=1 Tax=Candidatus Nomurabacteria bacterium CG10_big_fil_rev_8_21_14_0_10_35_16 TaxID=1974731 RepID=A0A2H0TBM6_9BACT|nr:MAG: hypothetical protein COU49_01015 [Candidatus Nomurabacteria bacterium CG10_big_fil_rev_8_21_14_0_10_35_16]
MTGRVDWYRVEEFRIIYHKNGKVLVENLGLTTYKRAFKKYMNWSKANPHGTEKGEVSYSEVAVKIEF